MFFKTLGCAITGCFPRYRPMVNFALGSQPVIFRAAISMQDFITLFAGVNDFLADILTRSIKL